MIVAMLPFCACRYSGLLGSSTGKGAYYGFDTDTNTPITLQTLETWVISNVICIPNEHVSAT